MLRILENICKKTFNASIRNINRTKLNNNGKIICLNCSRELKSSGRDNPNCKYKFDEAVADGVVLDLRYEARDIDQNISSQKKIDEWFLKVENSFKELYELCCQRGVVHICSANPTITEEWFVKRGLTLPDKINSLKGKIRKMKMLIEYQKTYDNVFYIGIILC
jgi:hypothetical protein